MSERLIEPTQFVLPFGYALAAADRGDDGRIVVTIECHPRTAEYGAAAYIAAIRREVETRAAEVIAARGTA